MTSLLCTWKHRPHNPPANAAKKERTKNLGCVGLGSHYFLRFHEFFSSILFWMLIREVFYSLFDEFSIRFVDNLTIETSPERWFCHLMSLRVEMFCRWRSKTSGIPRFMFDFVRKVIRQFAIVRENKFGFLWMNMRNDRSGMIFSRQFGLSWWNNIKSVCF